MSRRSLYLALAVLGAAVPYGFLLPYFRAEGIGLEFLRAIFANGAASGFTVDLILSSVVFWIFLFREAARAGVRHPWIYVAVTLTVGLSCALPLFLWVREKA
jgi:hypothetical protein